MDNVITRIYYLPGTCDPYSRTYFKNLPYRFSDNRYIEQHCTPIHLILTKHIKSFRACIHKRFYLLYR